ncbi:MAG: SoxR reducing system RseC family protein [Gammaproteobacteria bacterium]|nr:SoxR reducing system RseC family protein [Gammaproteobacteria bacterium]MCP5136878.1 SoxR reducing system RseC family protein [Gammaproteobacteria bacterium]
MIEETARVVRVGDGHAWVETQRRSSCGSCASKSGCGTSALGEWFGRRTVGLQVDNTIGAKVGEQVVIGVPETLLVSGAAWIYGLPLLTLLAGAGLSAWWVGDVHNDAVTALGGIVGLVFGFVLARRRRFWPTGNSGGDKPLILRVNQKFVVWSE